MPSAVVAEHRAMLFQLLYAAQLFHKVLTLSFWRTASPTMECRTVLPEHELLLRLFVQVKLEFFFKNTVFVLRLISTLR